ncbi:duffy binding protein 2 [Plasmodium vivax]|uniref:Duffy binding protein 2 n=2 Tax=Plasmodium vivax TaxID=5855 RepID=A0A1G4E8C0_PLAVI|nr:duffy binding protein 2 [Plasmodium vivax]
MKATIFCFFFLYLFWSICVASKDVAALSRGENGQAEGSSDISKKKLGVNSKGEGKISSFFQQNGELLEIRKRAVDAIGGTPEKKQSHGEENAEIREDQSFIEMEKANTNHKNGLDESVEEALNEGESFIEDKSDRDSAPLVEDPTKGDENRDHAEGADTLTSSVNNGKIPTNNVAKYVFSDTSLISGCNAKREREKWYCNLNGVQEQDICIPDRRAQMCINNLVNVKSGNEKKDLKEQVLLSLNTESQLLFNKWKKHNSFNNEEFCNDLNRDYADFGNLIKGTDIVAHGNSKEVEDKLKQIFGENENAKSDREKWWNDNKEEFWNKLLSSVKGKGKEGNVEIKECTKDATLEEIPQFQRWVQEWGKEYGEERPKKLQNLEGICKEKNGLLNENRCNNEHECKRTCTAYESWIILKKEQWDTISKKYDIVKDDEKYVKKGSNETAMKFLNELCKECNLGDFEKIINLKDDEYTKLCNCQVHKGVKIAGGSTKDENRGDPTSHEIRSHEGGSRAAVNGQRDDAGRVREAPEVDENGKSKGRGALDRNSINPTNEGDSVRTGKNKVTRGREGIDSTEVEDAKSDVAQKEGSSVPSQIKGSETRDARGKSSKEQISASKQGNAEEERDLQVHNFSRTNALNGRSNSVRSQNVQSRGKEKSDREEGGNKDQHKDDGYSNAQYNNLNVQDSAGRNGSRRTEALHSLWKNSVCNNYNTPESCENAKGLNSSEDNSNDDEKRVCCSIVGYCLKFFDHNSREYNYCVEKEYYDSLQNSSKQGFPTGILYFAAGGLFIVLAAFAVAANKSGNMSEEAAFSEFAEGGDNAYKLPLIYKEQYEEPNPFSYTEYNNAK